MRRYLIILSVLIVTFSSAQEVIVNYKYKNSKFTAKEITDEGEGDIIGTPKVKRNENALLEIEHNPFATKMTVLIEGENLHESANIQSDILSLVGIGNNLSATDLKLNINTKATMNDLFPSSKGANYVNKLNRERQSIESIRNRVIGVLINKNLSVRELKERVKEVVNQQDFIKIDNIEDGVGEAASKIFTYREDLGKIIEAKGSLSQINSSLINQGKGESELITGQDLEEAEDLITSNIENMENLEDILVAVSTAENKYIEIIEVDKDVVNVILMFEDSELLKSESNISGNKRESVYKIKAKGGWKINTSAALILNNYSDNSSDYFTDSDNVIGEDKNDFFIPSIGTTINFYPYWTENFNVGGIIGVSVPLQSNFNGLNFLLGGTTIIGNKNNVSLNAGITYGPVQRLRNGLEVGDTFSGDSNNLTREVYETGWFIGLSYKIFNIKD